MIFILVSYLYEGKAIDVGVKFRSFKEIEDTKEVRVIVEGI